MGDVLHCARRAWDRAGLLQGRGENTRVFWGWRTGEIAWERQEVNGIRGGDDIGCVVEHLSVREWWRGEEVGAMLGVTGMISLFCFGWRSLEVKQYIETTLKIHT